MQGGPGDDAEGPGLDTEGPEVDTVEGPEADTEEPGDSRLELRDGSDNNDTLTFMTHIERRVGRWASGRSSLSPIAVQDGE